ncbi:hypothetical protein [Halosolutus halophilus]|uniref:hypothetical protein n=1 Tax=Halosolutus halophilus TaxID=1552990 RepID=UPI002234EE4C|nr:hypothetical protein [Halosolutus halophilus]
MPTTGARSRIREWATTQRTITTLTAIVVAIPTANVFQSNTDGIAGRFFLLTALAVGVPTVYEDHWPKYDRTRKAVVWILVACAQTTIAFTALYVAGTVIAGAPSVLAAIGAFLVVYLSARRESRRLRRE